MKISKKSDVRQSVQFCSDETRHPSLLLSVRIHQPVGYTVLTRPPTDLRNELLRSMPPHELPCLLTALERITIERRRVLVQNDIPISHVYFPETALVCACSRSVIGPPMEVGAIGRFGFVGIPLLLCVSHSPVRFIAQTPGQVLRMEAMAFSEAVDRLPEFRRKLLRYVNAFQFQQSQLLVCNSRHSVEQRVARWLLTAAQRIGSCEICVTHDLIARMLGIRRASVSGAVAAYTIRGLLKSERGLMRINDWSALNAAACSCCSLILAEHARSHPLPPLETGSPNEADGLGAIRAGPRREQPTAEPKNIVLVVEDEFLVGEEILQALESKGSRILGPISHLKEALRLVASAGHIDAAVVDVKLGNEIALPLADALRGRDIPFVFVSGLSPDDVPSEYRDVPWFRKPFSIGDLTATVGRLASSA